MVFVLRKSLAYIAGCHCSKDVHLPVQMQRAMAAEAESTREAKAKVSPISLVTSCFSFYDVIADPPYAMVADVGPSVCPSIRCPSRDHISKTVRRRSIVTVEHQ